MISTYLIRFQSIAITSLLKLNFSSLWPTGFFSGWLLSPFDTAYQYLITSLILGISCPGSSLTCLAPDMESVVSRSPDFVYNFKITVSVLMPIAPGMVIVSGLFSGKDRKSIYLLIIIPTDIILQINVLIILIFPIKIQNSGVFYLAFSMLLLHLYLFSSITRFLVPKDTGDDGIRISHNYSSTLYT